MARILDERAAAQRIFTCDAENLTIYTIYLFGKGTV